MRKRSDEEQAFFLFGDLLHQIIVIIRMTRPAIYRTNMALCYLSWNAVDDFGDLPVLGPSLHLFPSPSHQQGIHL